MELRLQNNIYNNNLDTDKFAHMLDDTTQCYKFYWLEAILNLMPHTEGDMTFDAILDEMICNAWYTVTNYHLHLGPVITGCADNFLERAVRIVEQDPQLPKPATREQILAAIKRNEASLKSCKKGLIINVPYRLISTFLDLGGGDRLWSSTKKLIAYIEQVNERRVLPYTIIDGTGMEKRIIIDDNWRQLIYDNFPVIISWIQLKKIRFLQDRNPGVPGIIYKLALEPDNKRKLQNARELWRTASAVGQLPMQDIYTGAILEPSGFDLDHFVPWSYVTNDELWNLIPMDSSLNSSKSNRLPEWDLYFKLMAKAQYNLYKAIFAYDQVRERFEKCRRDNLNAIWASEQLYIEGNSQERFCNILEHNLHPIYESAKLQGYGIWNLPAH